MSNDPTQTSSVDQVNPEESGAENQERHVSEKAYKQVTNDMHKYKSKYKELEMKLNETQATLEAQQRAKLEEEKRFEELYRKAEEEKSNLLKERQHEKEQFMTAVKKSALKTELGGTIREEYLNLAKFNEIQVNDDGSLSSESVREVANMFRQEHPSLVPSSASGNITATAAPMNPELNSTPKSLNQMSYQEKYQAMLQIKEQKLKQGV